MRVLDVSRALRVERSAAWSACVVSAGGVGGVWWRACTLGVHAGFDGVFVV